MSDSLVAHHLVAAPSLIDPNFAGSVVFILEHGPEGALGLVLNRPTPAPVADHLPQWAEAVTDPPVVFVGGPVSNETAVGLAEVTGPVPFEWSPALPGIGLFDLSVDPGEVAPVRLRVFSGYSGWEAGQLEDELSVGGWIVLPAHPDDAFHPDPDQLRSVILRRQTGSNAWYSTLPENPMMN